MTNPLLPNLWCICNESLSLNVIGCSNQQVSFSVKMDNQEVFVSAIYACTTYQKRRSLWKELTDLEQSNVGPWCFIGDFNVVLGTHEQRGGHLPLKISSDEFQLWTDSCQLTHLMTRGAQFTWSNGRRGNCTEKRLDRAICNDSWLNYWYSVSCCTLTRSKSDHFPLLVSLKKEERNYSSSFKFFKMWSSHPDCIKVVSEVWSSSIVWCPMFILSQKLKMLKLRLKTWSKVTFGDVNKRVESAMAKVDQVQQVIISAGYSDVLFDQEKEVQLELQQGLSCQEDFWKEKARIDWHINGDRNTEFFTKLPKLEVFPSRFQ